MAKNLIIGQSGGPTAVINASLAGVIDYVLASDKIGTVYGMVNGVEGLLEENIVNLSAMFEDKPHEVSRLKHSPAMFLGSCRYKLSHNEEEYAKIFATFRKYDIGTFIYIGGNDSMDTVKKMADYTQANGIDIKVIGIPKTVDNDLEGIDHSPGFGSAAKYIATCVRNVAYDTSIYSIKSVHIIEAMGRNAGWLTAASVLARQDNMPAPHLVYLPEVPFSVEQFLRDVKEKLEVYNSVIVVVSEGINDGKGNYVAEGGCSQDGFGHAQLSGAGAYLKTVIEDEIGCKVRALEPSVLQRSAGHIASLCDVNEAFNLGTVAVKAAGDGKTGVFATLRRLSDKPYCVEYGTEKIEVVANQEKLVPREWINAEGNDVTDEMVRYLKPLIRGVATTPYRAGLPDYIDIRHLDTTKQKYKNEDE
ncbi:MAG: 6-phosphofructokinase [Ruminococcaceae bacterium]|nr:6-phosphofructokinase [Oscillospiraceae bacterium]